VPRRLLVSIVAALALGLPAGGSAAPGLFVGVADDYLKTEPGRAAAAIRSLGFSAVRLTLDWSAGQSALDPNGHAALQTALGAGGGLRVVVAVYSRTSTPLTEPDRASYCSYLRSIVTTFPQINDIVVWNEVNKSTFWRPQFAADGSSAAPLDYARLLAHCYEVLHAARPGINVIHAGLSSTGNDRPNADSNVSHSPGNFLRKEGEALRAELAGKRLFDTLGLHPYGENSAEPPWKQHDASSTIAIGDWAKLMQALKDAFAGTSQPYPGSAAARVPSGTGTAQVWYLETGFQTTPSGSGSGLYSGSETDPHALPASAGAARAVADAAAEAAPTHGSQLVAAIRRAYCQPYVGAYFNFLLRDEHDLGRWQSAPLWADWSPKPSAAALQEVIAEVRDRRVDCAALEGGPIEQFQERTGVVVKRVEWPKATSFNWRHDLWRFRIQAGESATYTAALVRVAPGGARPVAAGPVLKANGELKKLFFSIVKFPRKQLGAGRYRMEITLTSTESTARRTTLRGPEFVVRGRS
jgi:hypothetical protein